MSQPNEVTTAVLVDPGVCRNVTDLLRMRVESAPTHIAFDVLTGPADNGGWRQVSTEEFSREVDSLAKGIAATGIALGGSLAIMAPTSYPWAVADLAAMVAGVVVVPIYETSSVTQTSAILRDAEVKLAIAGTTDQATILAQAFARIGVTETPIWTIETNGLSDLAALGVNVSDEALEIRRTSATLDSVATIVYTSGTGGEPKGANITHRNLVGQVLNIAAEYTDVVRSDGNTVIFLPLAHVLARGLQLICLANGMRIAHVAEPRQAVGSLAQLRPTFLVVVPMVLQRIRSAAAEAAASKHLTWLWAQAEKTAIELGKAAEAIEADPEFRLSPGLRARRFLFERLFYRRLRALMGSSIEYLLSGAAQLDPQLALLFTGMGVPVIEGYGLTETTAPLTGNKPGNTRAGTVGVPQPGHTVRISDSGEVLAKGIGVFSGYRNPAHNEGAFTDGFFRTGDLGVLDDQGRLTITGRTKDVIVTSGGKTISTHRWEQLVETNPLVAHCVVVGEGQSHLCALVLLDTDKAKASVQGSFPTPTGQLDAIRDDSIAAAVAESISAANREVSRPEQVRDFAVLHADLTPGTPLITPTMKLRRGAFLDLADSFVADLYAVHS